MFPDEVTIWDKMKWRLRWELWTEQRAHWRNAQEGPVALEMIKLELMING